MAAPGPPADIGGVLTSIGFYADTRACLVDLTRDDFTMDSFLDYREENDFDALFTSLRRPGGEIGTAGDEANPLRTDPGFFVSTHAVDRFKTVCYMAQHRERVGRDHGKFAWYTVANIRT